MNSNQLLILGIGAFLFCRSMVLCAEPNIGVDWPQWRGPHRNGVVVSSPKLLDAWPKEGPALVWKADFLHAGETPRYMTDTGASSPVVADGRVFIFVEWARNYIVTRKMLDDWGWMDGVPDLLADKIEKSRLAQAKDLAGADLEKYIADFVVTLDPEEAKKYGALARKRLTLGRKIVSYGQPAATWVAMEHIIGAGMVDKTFPTFESWIQTKYKDKQLGNMIHGHTDGFWGANSMMRMVVRNAERTDVICCLDANTGKQLWKTEYPSTGSDYNMYWFAGASGTPAVADGKLYVAGGAGLYCLSVKDGKEVWKAKTTFTHCSPLVANGMVYVIFGRIPAPGTREGVTAEIKAFDAQTGELRWQQEKIGQTDGSPALWVHQGKSYLVIAAPGGLLCLDALTGAHVWKEKTANIEIGSHSGNSTPVISGDTVLVQGMAGYKLTPQKAEVLWHDKQGRTDYGAAGLIDKNIAYYGSGYTSYQCIDLVTGKAKWKSKPGGVQCFAPILADGKIFCQDGKGSFMMLRAGEEKYEELGIFTPSVSGRGELGCSISHAIAGGRLYLRLRDHVVCYDLIAK